MADSPNSAHSPTFPAKRPQPPQPPAPEAETVRSRDDGALAANQQPGPAEPADAVGTALRELFEQRADEWFGLALHLLHGRHDDAADVVQSAFVRCWQRRSQLGTVANLRGYVATTIANLARDEFRRLQRRPTVTLANHEVAHDGRRPEATHQAKASWLRDSLERDETLAAAHAAIQALRAEEREVFLLRQNGGMSYGEIAKALGLSEGTVKTRMRLALQRLRASLDRLDRFDE